MGLDMYLDAEKYTSATNWKDGEPVPTTEYKKLVKSMGLTMNDLKHVPFASYTQTIRIGYWRKANAIHAWFVKNVQNGVDDCKSYYVDTEKLAQLQAICEAVLKDVKLAKDILPTQSGFFFGCTEYGEWYIEDIKTTLKITKLALSEKLKGFDIHYRASW